VLATPAQAAAQTVTGHYDQTANGTYRLALADTSTNYGKLAVSGNVKLADASTIDVRLTGTPALSVDTVVRGVITAGGTMTTNANALTVTDNSALFNFNATTSRNAKELDLVITRDAAGLTRAVDPLRPNEAAVANALQTMINNGQPSSLDPLVNALTGLTTDQVTGAMSGLRPAVSGANAQAGMNALRATNNIIQSRVESYRGMSSGDSASERFMWLRALDSSGRQDDREGISGYKSDMRGLVLGADKPISPRTRVGMAFSSFRGDIRNAGPVAPSSVALDSYQLTGYSSIRTDDRTDVNLQLTLGKNKGASQRLAYAGGTAFANLNSMMVHAGAGVGRMYELGQDASLTPSLRLDYVEVRTDDYAERGATVANLLVNSQKARDLRLTPGVKYVHSFSGGTKFIGNAGLGYDLLNGETLTTASFAGGGPAFVTRAPAQSPWLATAGLALVHEDSKGSEWSLRYDVDSRTSGYRNQSLSVRLRKAF
jgi:outer membrane autotransporter protein